MARPARVNVVGGIYHVSTRGVRKTAVYQDDADRKRFLDLLETVVARMHWLCLSYCLLSTHYHLLVLTLRPNISRGMWLLNGQYARRFNERYGYEGHVFERRFAAELIEDEGHVFSAARYIDLNPVRAGICATPDEWAWSSYRAMVGLAEPAPFHSAGWLLRHFGRGAEGRLAYHGFVHEAVAAD